VSGGRKPNHCPSHRYITELWIEGDWNHFLKSGIFKLATVSDPTHSSLLSLTLILFDSHWRSTLPAGENIAGHFRSKTTPSRRQSNSSRAVYGGVYSTHPKVSKSAYMWQSEVDLSLRELCGIGLCNRWTPPGIFTASMGIAICELCKFLGYLLIYANLGQLQVEIASVIASTKKLSWTSW
jgi:hypothetical protein